MVAVEVGCPVEAGLPVVDGVLVAVGYPVEDGSLVEEVVLAEELPVVPGREFQTRWAELHHGLRHFRPCHFQPHHFHSLQAMDPVHAELANCEGYLPQELHLAALDLAVDLVG